ncbi:MAG: hypothetical protein mread185_000651 [Mycoplasmataceae bacterium]|nr:MAG: hypothetical protein mread185_000651 [Mycoplasmataceae bacterium]
MVKNKENNKNLSENITLVNLLKEKFGRDKVVVKKWNWTEEQLKQLEEEKRGADSELSQKQSIHSEFCLKTKKN